MRKRLRVRSWPKVLSAGTVKGVMDKDQFPFLDSDDPHFQHARALSLSVGAIRRAQGKCSPNDFPVGSLEWHFAIEDFAGDVLRALMGETENTDVQVGERRRD
ncbi:hypothetical protein CBA19CS22_01735 [Caballeronia novacaledonica]|uniref:Uncharacterized protein n=3 Tax=Caballeronia TaxID=1827195 RepID=A0ACB5QJT8_9BURK|nr:hypothetical protein CBA19CS22_01735 [Caballeronia novacaledonica]